MATKTASMTALEKRIADLRKVSVKNKTAEQAAEKEKILSGGKTQDSGVSLGSSALKIPETKIPKAPITPKVETPEVPKTEAEKTFEAIGKTDPTKELRSQLVAKLGEKQIEDPAIAQLEKQKSSLIETQAGLGTQAEDVTGQIEALRTGFEGRGITKSGMGVIEGVRGAPLREELRDIAALQIDAGATIKDIDTAITKSITASREARETEISNLQAAIEAAQLPKSQQDFLNNMVAAKSRELFQQDEVENQKLKNDILKLQKEKLGAEVVESQQEQKKFKTETATPTGEITNFTLNGRNISLDDTAAGTIEDINSSLINSGLMPLQINDSYRSAEAQSNIILNKAKEFGIDTQGKTIEKVAAEVRARGFQVADPGKSNHQSGMSIDIPGEQVDQPGFVKIMENNGWYQLDDPIARSNDRGHFNYKGTGSEPKPVFKTVDAAKNYGFATRMLDANILFEELEGKNFENDTDEFLIEAFGFGGYVPNVFKSEKEQMFDQAKRNFINAILRRESGAVIADSEFDNAEKQYFPQPGDTLGVLRQKRENRERATDGVFQGSQNYEMKDVEKQKRLADKFFTLSQEVGNIYNETGTGAGATLTP